MDGLLVEKEELYGYGDCDYYDDYGSMSDQALIERLQSDGWSDMEIVEYMMGNLPADEFDVQHTAEVEKRLKDEVEVIETKEEKKRRKKKEKKKRQKRKKKKGGKEKPIPKIEISTPFHPLPKSTFDGIARYQSRVDSRFERMVEFFVYAVCYVETNVTGGWLAFYDLVTNSGCESVEVGQYFEVVHDRSIEESTVSNDVGERILRENVGEMKAEIQQLPFSDLDSEFEAVVEDRNCVHDSMRLEHGDLKILEGEKDDRCHIKNDTIRRRPASNKGIKKDRRKKLDGRCFGCGDVGHFKRQCHASKLSCECCGRLGHTQPVCWKKDERCRQCGEVGHLKRMCTNACIVCGKKGHGMGECRYRMDKCFACGEVGHLKRVCDMKRHCCNSCGQEGHAELTCWRKKVVSMEVPRAIDDVLVAYEEDKYTKEGGDMKDENPEEGEVNITERQVVNGLKVKRRQWDLLMLWYQKANPKEHRPGIITIVAPR